MTEQELEVHIPVDLARVETANAVLKAEGKRDAIRESMAAELKRWRTGKEPSQEIEKIELEHLRKVAKEVESVLLKFGDEGQLTKLVDLMNEYSVIEQIQWNFYSPDKSQ